MPRRSPNRRLLLVAGDINLDLLARIPHFTGLGGDHLAPALEPRCGGVGLNTALALARWQEPARLLGAAGKDWFGDYLLSRARRRGVDVAYVQRTPAALTGLMLVVVSRGQQRTFFGSRGANRFFQWRPQSPRWLAGGRALHLVGYCFLSPSAARAARTLIGAARRRRLRVSLDVGIGPARLAKRAVLRAARRADILFASHEEAMALTRRRHPRAALRALEKAGVKRVVLKLGRKGCLYRENGGIVRAPALAVRGLDTTGCGDAFTAAFLVGWMRGWPLEESALAANAAGAAAATVVGAGENLPGRREVLRLLLSRRLAGKWETVRRRVVKRLRRKSP
jgi:ribokinase